MRRAQRLPRWLVFSSFLWILVACHGSTTTRTYVNRNNPSDKLTLQSSPSVTRSFYNAFHDDLKMFTGTYTLRSQTGTSSGTYEYAVRGAKKGYIFKPTTGTSWGVELNTDDSFNDASGVWQLEQTGP